MATSTVGFGKTYATLAAWAAAKIASAVAETAECYSGADLGAVDLFVHPGDRTITVAPGHQHNGTDAGTTGVAYTTGAITGASNNKNITVSQLRLDHPSTVDLITDAGTGTIPTFKLDSLLVIAQQATNASTSYTLLHLSAIASDPTPNMNAFVRNCIILTANHDEGLHEGIKVSCQDAGDVITLIENNTISGSNNMIGGIENDQQSSASANSIICYNNIVAGADVCYTDLPPDAAGMTSVGSNNFSSDGTIGGPTGTASDTFVNPVTNPTLKSTSICKNGGTTRPGYAVDAIGVARPQGAAWDIGALELVASSARCIRRVLRFWSH